MSNNASSSQIDELALIKQSVVYKNPELERQLYEKWYSAELTQRAKKLQGSWQGSCVRAVQLFFDTNEIKGYAKNNKVNSQFPEIGSVVITNESQYGHVGVVIAYTDKNITIYESNVPMGSEKAGIRTLKINDPRIKGYHEMR